MFIQLLISSCIHAVELILILSLSCQLLSFLHLVLRQLSLFRLFDGLNMVILVVFWQHLLLFKLFLLAPRQLILFFLCSFFLLFLWLRSIYVFDQVAHRVFNLTRLCIICIQHHFFFVIELNLFDLIQAHYVFKL